MSIAQNEFDNLKLGDQLLYVDKNSDSILSLYVEIIDERGFVFLNNKEVISKYSNSNVFLNHHDALKLQNIYLQEKIIKLKKMVLANQQTLLCEKNKYISNK